MRPRRGVRAVDNILRIARADFKRLSANVMSIIIAVGLVVVPSLFAWYNIIACWNVFDNTGSLTVAVANTDEGYKSDLVPIRVNVGDQVVSALRANDQIDAVARAWVTEDAVSVEVAGADGFEAAAAAEDGRSLFQGPALVLRETLPSGVYETRLYRYDGTIMEEYALADAPYDPLKATAIVDSSVFAFSYEDGLLTIETDAGATAVALRSGGGER